MSGSGRLRIDKDSSVTGDTETDCWGNKKHLLHVAVANDDSSPAARAHRQLYNHAIEGTTFGALDIIINSRNMAITLNDGSLIYKA